MIKCFKQYLVKKREVINKITGESWDGWINADTRPSEIMGGKGGKVMSTYIRAVVAAKAIAHKYGIPFGDLIDTLSDIPTADVAPVRRGAAGSTEGECPYKGA